VNPIVIWGMKQARPDVNVDAVIPVGGVNGSAMPLTQWKRSPSSRTYSADMLPFSSFTMQILGVWSRFEQGQRRRTPTSSAGKRDFGDSATALCESARPLIPQANRRHDDHGFRPGFTRARLLARWRV
jgi:hypothetical protein